MVHSFTNPAAKLNEMHDNDQRKKPNVNLKARRDKDGKKDEQPAAEVAAEPASDNLVHS